MKTLEQIAKEIKNCKECRRGKLGLSVPGEGNPKAKIMFIGEAPGRQEALTGRPFVGRAGKLLAKLFSSIGIKRENIFITSPIKYYPRKRKPTPGEIVHGKIHLIEQLKAINPKLVVLMGKVAHQSLVGDKKLFETHGKTLQGDEKIYFSTFHPAAALRFPKIAKLVSKDFKKLKQLAVKNGLL